MVAVCPQGWMRRWDNNGNIFHKMLDDWSIFSNADLVILSEEDLQKPSIRFSFCSYNTKEEVDYVIGVLKEFVRS